MTSELARRRFSEMVIPHLDDAYALARWLTGNASDAEDVVQDASIRALRALDSSGVANPRAWLLTIVRNTTFTWLAKNRPKAVTVPVDENLAESAETGPLPTPEESLIAAADQQAVQAAIAALPTIFRETLVMREINNLSYREISDVTGAPIGTVMSRLARARAMLMNSLGRTM